MLKTFLHNAPADLPLAIVHIADNALKMQLLSLGISAGDLVTIINRSAFKGPLQISCGENLIAVPYQLAQSIEVQQA